MSGAEWWRKRIEEIAARPPRFRAGRPGAPTYQTGRDGGFAFLCFVCEPVAGSR